MLHFEQQMILIHRTKKQCRSIKILSLEQMLSIYKEVKSLLNTHHRMQSQVAPDA